MLFGVAYRTQYAAAWVPEETEGLDRSENAALAVAWMQEQERRLHQQGHLFVPQKGDFEDWREDRPAIDQWVRGGRLVTSPRSGGPGDSGPVLVCYPTLDMVADASQRSARSAVCILEWGQSDREILTGWAKESRALNLLTGDVTPDDRTAELVTELQYILWSGNNGWHGKSAGDRVITSLRRLRTAGVPVRTGDVIGYMLAHGKSWASVQRLETLVSTV
jgi:hypothetical protein